MARRIAVCPWTWCTTPGVPVPTPAQARLEVDYRRLLGEQFGITFNRLLVLANMPIQRFGSMKQAPNLLSLHHHKEGA